MEKTLIIPAIYEGSRDLKDRTKKLTLVTNEITPEQAAQLQVLVGNFCYVMLKQEKFTKEEIETMTDLKSDYNDIGKSPAQRLRAVIYRIWEQGHQGYDDFNLFYNFQMEKMIAHFKGKLL